MRSKRDIIQVASAMLAGKMDLLLGCRKIWELRAGTRDDDDDIFSVIRAVEAEIDDIPLGDVRRLWDDDALREMDRKKAHVLITAEQDILRACEEIVRRYGQSSGIAAEEPEEPDA